MDYIAFRLWTLIGIGSLSMILLFTVWQFYYFEKRKKGDMIDWGLIFLIAGIGIWVLLAILKLNEGTEIANEKRHIFSMLNNALLTCSFSFFSHTIFSRPNDLRRNYWIVSVLIIAGIFLILILFVPTSTADILDFSFSTIVFIILAGILYDSFKSRELIVLGYLSFFVIILGIFGQFITVFTNKEWSDFIGAEVKFIGTVITSISFSMMMMILTALTFSWIFEKTHVFEEWKDNDKAIKFCNENRGKEKQAVAKIKLELSNGFLSYVFAIQRLFFNSTEAVSGKETVYKDLEDKFTLSSGRFNSVSRLFNQGRINFADYTLEINKISYNMTEALDELEQNIEDTFKYKGEL